MKRSQKPRYFTVLTSFFSPPFNPDMGPGDLHLTCMVSKKSVQVREPLDLEIINERERDAIQEKIERTVLEQADNLLVKGKAPAAVFTILVSVPSYGGGGTEIKKIVFERYLYF